MEAKATRAAGYAHSVEGGGGGEEAATCVEDHHAPVPVA